MQFSRNVLDRRYKLNKTRKTEYGKSNFIWQCQPQPWHSEWANGGGKFKFISSPHLGYMEQKIASVSHFSGTFSFFSLLLSLPLQMNYKMAYEFKSTLCLFQLIRVLSLVLRTLWVSCPAWLQTLAIRLENPAVTTCTLRKQSWLVSKDDSMGWKGVSLE